MSQNTRDEISQELLNASSQGDLAKMKELIQMGADVNFRAQWGNTALSCCGATNQLEIMAYLLEQGADPNVPGYNGHSAVGLKAYDEGQYDAVKLLLSHGANPNQVREETGETPLHLAIAKSNLPGASGRTECVKALLEAGADPNIVTKHGVDSDCFYGVVLYSEAPLHWAAAYGDEEMVKALIKHGARIDLKDGRGDLPAHYAGRHWRPDSIRSLLY